MKKSLNENFRQIALLEFKNHSIKHTKCTENTLQRQTMSTSNFQLRLDGLRWRIKLMQNTPTASLFYCRARDGHDNFIFPKN